MHLILMQILLLLVLSATKFLFFVLIMDLVFLFMNAGSLLHNSAYDFVNPIEICPLPRIVNDFEIVPCLYTKGFQCYEFMNDTFERLDRSFFWVWSIAPKNSIHIFYFPRFRNAAEFAERFQNEHSRSFWSKVQSYSYPLLSLPSACKILDNKCMWV